MAGLDAGLTYNSYPKMADKWIPDDMWVISPKWRNIFENPTFVQFNHRHLVSNPVTVASIEFGCMCSFEHFCEYIVKQI